MTKDNGNPDKVNGTAYDAFVSDKAINAIANELIAHLHNEAKAKRIIDADTLEKYDSLYNIADGNGRTHVQRLTGNNDSFKRLIEDASTLGSSSGRNKSGGGTERLEMSKLLAMESIVCNAVRNLEHDMRNTMVTSAHKEAGADNGHSRPERNILDHEEYSKARFVEFIENTLDTAKDKKTGLEQLETAKDKLLLSIVYTAHPTVFHTEAARESEWKLTQDLAEARGFFSHRAEIKPNNKGVFAAAKQTISDMVDNIKTGGKLTPMKRVTVSEENATEEACWNNINKQIDTAVTAWNKAVKEVANSPKYKDKEKETGIEGTDFSEKLKITDKKKNEFVQKRTWNRSADADGRELATSIELYRAIHSELKPDGHNQKYDKPILDLRQNSEIHQDLVSSLIQRLYNDSVKETNALKEKRADNVGAIDKAQEFSQFCNDFSKDHGNIGMEDGKFVFQKLGGHKAEFLEKLLKRKEPEVFVPKVMEDEVVKFNDKFMHIYEHFIKIDHKLPVTTSLNDLKEKYEDGEIENARKEGRYARSLFVELQKKVYEETKYKDDDGKEHCYMLQTDGSYQHVGFDGHDSWLDNTLKAVKVKDEKDDKDKKDNKNDKYIVSSISVDDRRILIDTVKRMLVTKNALNDGTISGTISDRYQIANFEDKSDFYAMLLLMQQTGLINIKDKKVIDNPPKANGEPVPVIGIQPLIETLQDMKKAPDMFKELLKDPLVQSYYQKRGKAEFMIGFSDGAKSAGSFASEWEAYKCIRDLKKTFSEANIENVDFFEGRGRGTERGGLIEAGLASHMLPPEVAVSGKRDQTIQADLPMDMAGSQGYGTQQITGLMIGTMSAQIAAQKHLDKFENNKTEENKKYQEQYASYEKAMDKIAEISSKKYHELVAKDPESLKFLDGQFTNSDRSSRTPKREGTAKKDFDSQRAITIEYGMGQAGVVIHNVGLRTALEEFANNKDNTVLDKNGKKVSGHEALNVLYERFKPFRIHVDKTVKGMEIYNPEKFKAYAEMSGTKDWAERIITELSGKTLSEDQKKDQKILNSNSIGLEHVLKHIQQHGMGKSYRDKEGKRHKAGLINVDEAAADNEKLAPVHAARMGILSKIADALLLSSRRNKDGSFEVLDSKTRRNMLDNGNVINEEAARNCLFTLSHPVAHRETSHRLQNALIDDRIAPHYNPKERKHRPANSEGWREYKVRDELAAGRTP